MGLEIIDISIFGKQGRSYTIKASATDQITLGVLSSKGKYEEHLTRFFRSQLQDKSVVIDVGANIGIISILMADVVTKGTIYSFEPGSIAFNLLKENIALNQLQERVHPIRLGLSDTSAQRSFVVKPDGLGGGHFSELVPSDNDIRELREEVSCTTLDEWVELSGISRLDLIKIDVEGFEENVIRGAKDTLRRFKPDIILEFNLPALNSVKNNGESNLLNLLYEEFPTIYVVYEHGQVRRAATVQDLYAQLAHGRGIEDLLCTFKTHTPKIHLSPYEKCFLTARRLKRKYWDNEISVVRPDYSLTLETQSRSFRAGSRATIPISLKNTSDVALSSHYKNPVHLAYHILKGNDKIIHDGMRTILPKKIKPGETVRFEMQIEVPKLAGSYSLQPSLVQENYCWFYEVNPKLRTIIPLHVI